MTTTTARPSTTGSDTRAEAPRTLDEPAPRTLGLTDQLGLWGNLGVSLLGFTGAIYVLEPTSGPALSIVAAVVALLVGTVLGTLAVSLAAVPGADTGQPAMVLLRGLFGTRSSYLPTVLNVIQLFGWSTFELVTISTALHQITPGVPRWVYVLASGVVTTGLALRPLGWIRVLRRYVTIAVVITLAYLFAQLLRNPLPSLTHGTWHGFWIAVDTVVGVSVSFVPLAADYSRHSRTARAAFGGSFVGYSVTQVLCYALGLIALVTVAHGNPDRIFGSFMAVPVGTLAFAILAVRELDQSFADTYSSAVSVQNLRPRWDRRVLALLLGAIATVFALALNIDAYENFLTLIGSVFVPLAGVLVVDYFVVSRRRWRLDEDVRPRWATLAAWVLGFVVYQLINPGFISWWASMWGHVDDWLHVHPTSWTSASLLSFLSAALVTLPLGVLEKRRLLEHRKEPEC